jgi:alginate O-acetyltransferase complex protein AlgI
MHYLSPEFALLFLAFIWIYWRAGWLYGPVAQNRWLLIASYLFYISFDWRFAVLLLVFSLVILGLARLVPDGYGGQRRWPVVIGVLLALVNLGVFKYYNFFREEALEWLLPFFNNASLPVLDLLLPVGISFYTFQGLAYLISVGRGETVPAKLEHGLLFLSFFPTLLAGPICRPNELLPQIQMQYNRSISTPDLAFLLILSALIKKIWLSAWLAEAWVNPVFANPDGYHAIELICAVMAYAWQLFFDFSGYTDLVTALAIFLGFQLPRNFNQPYLAKSISEFWQRWHISLSRWIRDFVYIPLGGNRGSWGRTQINALIAMTLSGFWHGASVTFIVWGLWHGVGLILQNIWQKIGLFKLPGIIAQIMTFIFVCVGWLMFRAEDWESVELFLAGLADWQTMPRFNWIGLLVAVAIFFWAANRAESTMTKATEILSRWPWWTKSILLVVGALLVIELSPPGMPGFIYFGF